MSMETKSETRMREMDSTKLTAERMDLLLGNLLRVGVAASFLVTVAGVVVLLWQHPEYLHDSSTRTAVMGSSAVFPHSLGDLASGVVHGEGRAIIALGVLLLITTPVARVVGSIIGFAMQRDRLYCLMTLAVLGVLVVAFLLGRGE